MNRASVSCGKTSSGSISLESPEERREWGLQKNIWRHNCWKFPNVMKPINPQVQEALWILSTRNIKLNTRRYIIIKLLKVVIIQKLYRGTNMDESRFHIRNNTNEKIIYTHIGATLLMYWKKKTVNLEFYT